MQPESIIDNIPSLKNLVKDIGLFKTANKNIRIHFNQLTEVENMELQHQVVKYYKTCGCSQGRITGIITLVVFVVLLITGIISIRELGVVMTFVYYFVCSFVTMLIAKVIGIWQARKQLTKLAERIEHVHRYVL